MYRIFSAFCLASIVLLASSATAQSPFTFVQRQDVKNEINAAEAQSEAVELLGPSTEALIQDRLQQMAMGLPNELLGQFQAMSESEQMGMLDELEGTIRETTEMEVLDSTVLDENQMTRFEQLWTQNAGVGGLTSGRVGNTLGVSDDQYFQIQNIMNASSAAMDACLPSGTGGGQTGVGNVQSGGGNVQSGIGNVQQNIQIQIIQNNTIDLCVACLTEDQIKTYMDMYGKPFEFDNGDDMHVDDGELTGQLETDTESTEGFEIAPIDEDHSVGANASSTLGQSSQGFDTASIDGAAQDESEATAQGESGTRN